MLERGLVYGHAQAKDKLPSRHVFFHAATSLIGPAMRYASLLYRTTNLPGWATAHLDKSWASVKTMQLGFAVPLFVVLLQVRGKGYHTGSWGVIKYEFKRVALGTLL